MYLKNSLFTSLFLLAVTACGDSDGFGSYQGSATEIPGDTPDGCVDGETAPGLCLGYGLVGERQCTSGLRFGQTTCEYGMPIETDTSYVILTRGMFLDEVATLSDYLRLRGERVQVLELSTMIEYVAGRDVPERIRLVLKQVRREARDASRLLIIGAPVRGGYTGLVQQLSEPWEVPFRFTSYTERALDALYPEHAGIVFPSIWYYADLHSTWPIESGELDADESWKAEFSFDADLQAFILPAREAGQVTAFVEKLRSWRAPNRPVHSFFDNHACLDGYESKDRYAEKLTENGLDFRMHNCADGESGDVTELASVDKSDFVTITGHGNTSGMSSRGKAYGLMVGDEFDSPPVVIAKPCRTGAVSYGNQSLGEWLMVSPEGAAAYVGFADIAWGMNQPLLAGVFTRNRMALGEAVYGSMGESGSRLLNTSAFDNLFLTMPMGDPGMELYRPDITFTVSGTSVFDDGLTVRFDVSSESTLEREVRGQLVFLNGDSEGQGIDALVKPGHGEYVLEAPVHDKYPLSRSNVLIGFSGCGPEGASCTPTMATVEPVYPLMCGLLHQPTDGIVTMEVESAVEIVGVGLRLDVYGLSRTWHPNGCGENNCGQEEKLIASVPFGSKIKDGLFGVDLDASSMAFEKIPDGDFPNGIVVGPILRAEVIDGSGQILAKCRVGDSENYTLFIGGD